MPKHNFRGWETVIKNIDKSLNDNIGTPTKGQKCTLKAIANRIKNNGVILADEVGMGKTRITALLAKSVIDAGGRVAIIVPPGLGYQWNDELNAIGQASPPILRSLWQYYQAWNFREDDAPWFDESIVLISHAFANWRFGENSAPWRYALLPEIYAQYRKYTYKRYPRGYHATKYSKDSLFAEKAAKSIISHIKDFSMEMEQRLKEIIEHIDWPQVQESKLYSNNEDLRKYLENAIGLGLGSFDLLIIDEAHKSRGKESKLNQLLNHVLITSKGSKRVAMSATPVELDSRQWIQSLERICVKNSTQINIFINNYIQSVDDIRRYPHDSLKKEAYMKAAKEFENALEPYVLRRDKREEESLKKFKKYSGEPYYAYRVKKEIYIEPKNLQPEWKKIIFAAEALSIITKQKEDPVAKRVRLTLGNGHGIATLIDQIHKTTEDEDMNDELITLNPYNQKNKQRIEWWLECISENFLHTNNSLYRHPSILKAIEKIEEICSKGEKVLVFGRFTKPMKALEELLNARELIRCVENNLLWPHAEINSDQEKTLNEVLSQNNPQNLNIDKIKSYLKDKYKEIINLRRRVKNNILQQIEDGLCLEGSEIPDKNHRINQIFSILKQNYNEKNSDGEDERSLLSLLARGMIEILGKDIEGKNNEEVADAFRELIDALIDRDEGDSDGDGILDDEETANLWGIIKARLHEEYHSQTGGFARLMNGSTRQSTRRYLQLAFNREHAYPKVLIAQSKVGREGLNLHKACRSVILLHPEWNPGIVEQQIGRIDRLDSLWERMLQTAIEENIKTDNFPRIEIYSIIFAGTYDERNWEILKERWDNLRAQLHGVVLSEDYIRKHKIDEKIANEINKCAPNFSPLSAKHCINKDKNIN